MTPETDSLTARVSALVSAAGIDNFRFENNILVMCGVRYFIEQCGCADPACNGVRLRREKSDGNKGYFALQ